MDYHTDTNLAIDDFVAENSTRFDQHGWKFTSIDHDDVTIKKSDVSVTISGHRLRENVVLLQVTHLYSLSAKFFVTIHYDRFIQDIFKMIEFGYFHQNIYQIIREKDKELTKIFYKKCLQTKLDVLISS